ncbi:MAG: DNA repair protein RecN [Oscillospiraceae bacterium]|nr:DNA repair protein RecN [Oscillospiraceae bacterium]
MLRYIEISDIALIDRASIDFGPGLSVLTGETGAGKSIIIDSINAVLGARATRDIVRKDAASASVAAVFSIGGEGAGDRLYALLEECGVEPADMDELVLGRDIGAAGRSVCRVNGKLVTSPVLRAIGEQIVDLHGQHENHSLMKREKHIDMIDYFAGHAFMEKREAYAAQYSDYWRIKRQIADLVKSESERAHALDVLTFQVNEIKAVKPQPREDERLLVQIEALANAEKINNALASASDMLSGGGDGQGLGGGGDSGGSESGRGPGGAPSVLGGIALAARSLGQISSYSPEYAELLSRIEEARFIIEDIASTLRQKRGADDLDPARLDALSARHEAIERLKRKYGGTIKDVHDFYRQSLAKLNELADSEQTAKDLEARLSEAGRNMALLAAELTDMRRTASAAIEEGVALELADLEMNNCRFRIMFSTTDNIDEYGPKGRDQAEFLFCANPGEELRPLVRIASGGEMSRVMLAIKSVLAGADNIPTMIFDEIDAGISGKAAARVAEKMHLLAKGRQIICVTHLAQIACMADDQYLIEKTSTDNATQTRVIKLEPGSRADEISRMLGGGAPTEASLRLSGELLERAQAFKESHAKQETPL